jgi:hypothetical protein
MVLAECLFTKRPMALIIWIQSLRFTEVYGVPRKILKSGERIWEPVFEGSLRIDVPTL